MSRRVLIIEDDPDQAAQIMRLLRLQAGMTAAVAANFADGLALSKSKSETFDCAIVDLGLPDMPSSAATVERLDELGLPIVCLTGDGTNEIFRRVRETGAAIVAKPGSDLLVEKVWSQINYRSPDVDSESGQRDAQRKIISGAGRSWLENKAAVISIVVTLATTSATVGGWLYHGISNEARKAEITEHTLAQHEKQFVESDKRHAEHELQLGIIRQQNQISIDDRSSIHAQISTVKDSQIELKMDVIRRLERIEDKLDRRTGDKTGN